jgi:diacylglycerol kinase family enzyme
MQVVLIHNPASGKGHAAPPSRPVIDRLKAAGHAVSTLDAGPGLTTDRLCAELSGTGDSPKPADLCVVVGGDGTLHYALPALVRTRTPVYHVPFGTENLFARQFRMSRDPDRLLRAIAHDHLADVDLGECNRRPFAIMCSVGFDSAIVERVAAARTHGVSKLDYIRRGLSEILSPRIPALSLAGAGPLDAGVVDAVRAGSPAPGPTAHAPIATKRTGLLVIANSRQYAARLDPARDASMTDGQLDVVMYPHAGRFDLAAWLALTAVGLHTRVPALLRTRTPSLTVTLHSAPGTPLPPPQMDGESVPLAGLTEPTPGGDHTLTARVLPKALRVLQP